jgi:hypothetical protein
MLRLDELRKQNVLRCETLWHKVSEWSPDDWLNAVIGELGSVAHAIKAYRRRNLTPRSDPDIFNADPAGPRLAEEMADTLIYFDLLCARIGISDLGVCVRDLIARYDTGGVVFKGDTILEAATFVRNTPSFERVRSKPEAFLVRRVLHHLDGYHAGVVTVEGDVCDAAMSGDWAADPAARVLAEHWIGMVYLSMVILAVRCGVDLDTAVREKFNRTSEEWNCHIKL